MKYIITFITVLILGVLGWTFWSQTPKVDSTGKIHVNLYDGASGSWDSQMEVLLFESAPSTYLSLKWQPPTMTYNHFLLTISDEQGEIIRKESGEHDRVSLDPDALDPGTTYLFVLQACLEPACTSWLIADTEYSGTTALSGTEDEGAITEAE